MALQLSFENDMGLTGDYWRINSVAIDFVNQAAEVNISLYKDAAAYAAGKSSMYLRSYTYTTADDDGVGGTVDNFTGIFDYATLNQSVNSVAGTYTKLKLEPDFAGAVDV